jgi:hypothetical protein
MHSGASGFACLETRLWTCCAGRAWTRIRSEDIAPGVTLDVLPRIARERVRARPQQGSVGILPAHTLRVETTQGNLAIRERPGARPYHPMASPNQIVKPTGLFAETLSIFSELAGWRKSPSDHVDSNGALPAFSSAAPDRFAIAFQW